MSMAAPSTPAVVRDLPGVAIPVTMVSVLGGVGFRERRASDKMHQVPVLYPTTVGGSLVILS